MNGSVMSGEDAQNSPVGTPWTPASPLAISSPHIQLLAKECQPSGPQDSLTHRWKEGRDPEPASSSAECPLLKLAPPPKNVDILFPTSDLFNLRG